MVRISSIDYWLLKDGNCQWWDLTTWIDFYASKQTDEYKAMLFWLRFLSAILLNSKFQGKQFGRLLQKIFVVTISLRFLDGGYFRKATSIRFFFVFVFFCWKKTMQVREFCHRKQLSKVVRLVRIKQIHNE